MKFDPLADHESNLDKEMEEEAWGWLRILCKSAIGLLILIIVARIVPWAKLWGGIALPYAVYLLTGLLCGFCAGIIVAVAIQEWRRK